MHSFIYTEYLFVYLVEDELVTVLLEEDVVVREDEEDDGEEGVPVGGPQQTEELVADQERGAPQDDVSHPLGLAEDFLWGAVGRDEVACLENTL